MNTIPVAATEPLGHSEAMDLLASEFERTNDLLASLDDGDWSAQTECPAWDVRRMYLAIDSRTGLPYIENAINDSRNTQRENRIHVIHKTE